LWGSQVENSDRRIKSGAKISISSAIKKYFKKNNIFFKLLLVVGGLL
jgi:hypothetical protein